MVKLVYTYALGAYAARRAGSSPVAGTIDKIIDILRKIFRRYFLYNNIINPIPDGKSINIIHVTNIRQIYASIRYQNPVYHPSPYSTRQRTEKALAR